MKKQVKMQSATEYLTTYGWSILLVAIVLAAFLALGGFGAHPLSSSNSCLSQSGYLCSKPILNSSGYLTATVGQTNGGSEMVTALACTNSSTSPTTFTSISPVTLNSGQSSLFSFQCPLSSGSSIGAPFSGSLWIKYNYGGSTGAVTKVGNVNAVVSTSSGIGLNSCNPSSFVVSNTINLFQYTPIGTYLSANNSVLYVVNSGSGTVSTVSVPNFNVLNLASVGSFPELITPSPNGQNLYVTNYNSGTVSIMAASNSVVTGTVSTSTHPVGMAFTPNGNYYYVSNALSSGTVSVVAASNNVVVKSISVGRFPEYITSTLNGSYMYVGNMGATTVSVISTATNLVTNTLTVDSAGPGYMTLTSSGSQLFVANPNYGDNTVSSILTSNNVVTNIATGPNPSYLVQSPNGKFMYAINENTSGVNSSVSVIGVPNNTVVKTIRGLFMYAGYAAITPSGRYLYVTNQYSNKVSIIATSNNTVVRTVNVGVYPSSVTISSDGNYAYVLDQNSTGPGTGMISVISNYGC